jgi:hypothetical protein
MRFTAEYGSIKYHKQIIQTQLKHLRDEVHYLSTKQQVEANRGFSNCTGPAS